jgi:hypothetical protein
MTEFFDKLRVDRKLDEALHLMKEIQDPSLASRIKGIIALSFSEVALDKLVLTEVLMAGAPSVDQNPTSQEKLRNRDIEGGGQPGT